MSTYSIDNIMSTYSFNLKVGSCGPSLAPIRYPCTVCNQLTFQRCSNCQIYYCSKNCQRKHWPEHKKECKSPIIALNKWNNI